MPGFIRVRDGSSTLIRLAQGFCFALGKFTPYLIEKYPENAALQAALAAASAACAVLRSELAKIHQVGD